MAENITREELARRDTMEIVEKRTERGRWPWALVRRPGMPDREAWAVLDLYVAVDDDHVQDDGSVLPDAPIALDVVGEADVDEWMSEARARKEFKRLVGIT